MKIFLFLTISLCMASADEVLVQVNVNKPINEISDRFLSFLIDPRIIIENLNTNNSEKLNIFASELGRAYLKLSMVPLATCENCEKLKSKHNQELQDWKNLHEWLRSVNWIPVIPLPYNPNEWESLATLRILNISSTIGLEKCVWQLGSDFDAIGAASYVADLITLQTMVDAFKSLVDGWGVIGADISAGSDLEETKLYSDLTKHIVDAIGWMQPSDTNVPETQNSIVYDSDFALKALLARQTPVWLSIASNLKKCTDSWPGISTAHGVQWARILGDAARTGFSVIYKPLSSDDIFEENLSYFASLIFKQIMGNKVFDARVIGGTRFISHVYCHCTKNKPGALSIMAINIGDNRHKIDVKMNTKFTGPEMWQYILTSNNKTTYLNGVEVHFNSTMEPFVKVKHPTRPITLMLPPMSIGFWVLPLANNNECLVQTEEVDERKRYMRIRTSSDLLLQHLIEENAALKNKNVLKKEDVLQDDDDNAPINIMKLNDSEQEISESKRRRRRRSVPQDNVANKDIENPTEKTIIAENKEKSSNKNKRQLDDQQITEIINQSNIPRLLKLTSNGQFDEKNSLKKGVRLPSEDIYFELKNVRPSSKLIYDNVNDKRKLQLSSSEENLGKSQTPDIFYEVYQIHQSMPRNPVDIYEIERHGNGQNSHQILKDTIDIDCDGYAGALNEFRNLRNENNLKRPSTYSRARKSICAKKQNARKRRSPLYKAISMTNLITKDMEDETPPRQYFTYALNKNFLRPINFDEAAWKAQISTGSDNDDDPNNLIGKYEEPNIENDESEISNDSSVDEHSPKFMMLVSDNVSKFMKMLNHHVSGWWNTWA